MRGEPQRPALGWLAVFLSFCVRATVPQTPDPEVSRSSSLSLRAGSHQVTGSWVQSLFKMVPVTVGT